MTKIKLNTLLLLLAIVGPIACFAQGGPDDVILKPNEFDIFAGCCVDVNALSRDTTRMGKENQNLKKQLSNNKKTNSLDSTAIVSKDQAISACESNYEALEEKFNVEEKNKKGWRKAFFYSLIPTGVIILAEIIRIRVL